jgi:hypothetical protein
MKNKKIPHCRNISKIKCQNRWKRENRYLNTHKNDRTLSWLGTCTSIKRGEAKLALWAQTSPLTEMMRSCKCFPFVSKMSTLSQNRENSVVIKTTIILNIIHNIFNLHDTNVVICIILFLLNRADGPNHYLNVR